MSTTTSRRPPLWAVATISGFFGLLFAYAVWTAVNYLVATVQAAGVAGLSMLTMGWVVWVLAIILPILLFAVAVVLGRRRGLLSLTLFLLTALALVAVFWLDVVAYTTTVPIIG
ncbi:hypothetical protein E4U02_12840 [Microbacterium paludicola]|uniref:Uncharacterized protein n=1 Tax=Microbacterium paludicola TaxID=300019 RepID=A0A4Y9FSF8_9MICO|nr:hypothetical protein [Microbacterium paludicola]MBF0817302.1 hypothetical protein [Microbacterium paludicola]TFU31812.1 hypothetical protein E4U02_12840 [Microbacterium paludicola]